jgi:hypothetical protein
MLQSPTDSKTEADSCSKKHRVNSNKKTTVTLNKNGAKWYSGVNCHDICDTAVKQDDTIQNWMYLGFI